MILKKPFPYFFVMAVSLLAVGLLDQGVTWLTEDFTLSPPLSIIALGLLAFFFSWRQVLLAVPCFTILSYFLVLETARFPMVRAASVGVAGVLAAWAAAQRGRIVRHSVEVETILKTLPVPWILSDESGNITRISDKACLLVSSPVENLVGASYFSFLSPAEGKGEFIRKYLDAFSSASLPVKTKVVFASSQATQRSATFFSLDFAEGKRLLTVLESS